ncbi:uncharacterized protein LOC120933326 [Rana temporaria]|uniref:uncharacterized protein LOC120933326 n=1 Tax=Rana temporaria TaxID=8407 RepID=UPI001AADB4D8|nr:uncharacterized protein LOC120933326 [Rana temporaria]
MSWRDGSADGRPARRDTRSPARRDTRSPPRRNPYVPRDRSGPDRDFRPSSTENPRRPSQRTDQNRRDKDERMTQDRTWKDRDPDRSMRNDGERNRRPETRMTGDRERNQRPDTTPPNNRERNRRPDTTPPNNRERDQKRETTSSNDREKDEKSKTTPSQKPDVPEKPQIPTPTPSNGPEKQKKTEPAPKIPDPPQSLVQGVVPEHIRRSVYVLKDYLPIKEREPIIGLEYVMEYRVQIREARVEIKYFCELCEMDSAVVPMLDHLCGYKHRKNYVAKEYPFVLRALFSSKEDRALFMRRMAVEIEEEDGVKMYKNDPIVRMVPMMNVKSTEAKKSKRKTRWDPEGERQKKMKQVLKILDSFVIGDEDEAATVTRLLQKVTSVVKFHTDKIKEQSLFPVKVARAQNVATTFVKNAIRARLAEQNIFPLLELGNISLHTLGRPFHPDDLKPMRTLNATLAQRLQGPPLIKAKPNPQMPLPQANTDVEIDETDEDIEFFKQLVALLELLPEDPTTTTTTTSSKMDSEILLLQSFLRDNANLENAPANQLMQAVPLTQNLASMGNVTPFQQLNIAAATNPAAVAQFTPNVLMPMAPVVQNPTLVENAQADQNLLLQMVELLQGKNPIVNTSLLENQNLQKRECIETVNRSAVMVEPTAHRPPFMDTLVTTSRGNEGFGFERPMAGKFENTNKRQYDDSDKSAGYRSNEPKRNLFADMSSNTGVRKRKWDVPFFIPKKGENRAEQAPFTRVSLPPPNIQRLENERLQGIGYERDLRPDYRSHEARPNFGGLGSRPLDDPAWAGRERDMPFGKRAKLDSGFATTRNADWGGRYPEERGSIDTGAPNLSADLLKMIRGKDLYTVSAILSGYTK